MLIFFDETKLHILGLFKVKSALNVDFMAKSPKKMHKIGHISVYSFYPIAVTKKVSHPLEVWQLITVFDF